jgi:hypothetical protein
MEFGSFVIHEFNKIRTVKLSQLELNSANKIIQTLNNSTYEKLSK